MSSTEISKSPSRSRISCRRGASSSRVAAVTRLRLESEGLLDRLAETAREVAPELWAHSRLLLTSARSSPGEADLTRARPTHRMAVRSEPLWGLDGPQCCSGPAALPVHLEGRHRTLETGLLDARAIDAIVGYCWASLGQEPRGVLGLGVAFWAREHVPGVLAGDPAPAEPFSALRERPHTPFPSRADALLGECERDFDVDNLDHVAGLGELITESDRTTLPRKNCVDDDVVAGRYRTRSKSLRQIRRLLVHQTRQLEGGRTARPGSRGLARPPA